MRYPAVTAHSVATFLGAVLVLATTDENMPDHLETIRAALEGGDDVENVEEVITSFKNEDTLINNVLTIAAKPKKQIAATIDYLSSLGDQFPSAVKMLNQRKNYRTKEDIAWEISNFCFEITPATCKKCTTEYIPSDQHKASEDKCVQCILCDKAGHHSCYSNDAIDSDNGIVFLCDKCLKASKGTRLATIKLISTVTIHEQKTEPISKKPEKDEEESDRMKDDEDDFIKVEKTKRYKKVCPLYKQGICPFGRSGRECSKQHPPHCRRWTSNGNGEWGCRWGDECWFFHPDICEHSEKLKKCLDLDCPKIHLKGTQRYEQRFNEEDFNQYPRFTSNYNRRMHDNSNNYRGHDNSNNYTSNRGRYNEGNTRYTKFNRDTNNNKYGNYNNRNQNYHSRSKEHWQNHNADRNQNYNQSQRRETENQIPNQEVTSDFLGQCLKEVKKEVQNDLKLQLQQHMQYLQRAFPVPTQQQYYNPQATPQTNVINQQRVGQEVATNSAQYFMTPMYSQVVPPK